MKHRRARIGLLHANNGELTSMPQEPLHKAFRIKSSLRKNQHDLNHESKQTGQKVLRFLAKNNRTW